MLCTHRTIVRCRRRVPCLELLSRLAPPSCASQHHKATTDSFYFRLPVARLRNSPRPTQTHGTCSVFRLNDDPPPSLTSAFDHLLPSGVATSTSKETETLQRSRREVTCLVERQSVLVTLDILVLDPNRRDQCCNPDHVNEP